MPKTLATRPSVWTAVYRRIVRQLTTDPALKNLSVQWRTYDGNPNDRQPLTPTFGKPIVRLTPKPRSVDWYSPDLQRGWLDVECEIAVATESADDPIDLHDYIVQAVRPGATDSQGNPFALDLAALGAETGEIIFHAPAFADSPAGQPSGILIAVGVFTLAIMRPVNP
jgi:hypothetical protein